MLDNIVELRKIRAEIALLKGREKYLKKPALDDFSLIPVLYGWFLEILDTTRPPNPDSVYQRKRFLFVIIMLYSPTALCGGIIRAGLCAEFAKLFNLTTVSISRNISDVIFYYENYRDYTSSVEDIYLEFIRRLKGLDL
jgi:hypothetical protein